MIGIPLQESVAVTRQAEEIVLFFYVVDWLLVNGAVPILEIILDVVRLAWNAVEPAVGVEFDVPIVVAGPA